MKKLNTIYWSVTGLFAAFMLFTAIPDIMVIPEAVAYMNKLGYPDYLLPFIGVAKALGCIAILLPGFPRLKEWAYAGLFIDLVGAAYSVTSVEGLKPDVLFILLPIALLFYSHFLWHKKLKTQNTAPETLQPGTV